MTMTRGIFAAVLMGSTALTASTAWGQSANVALEQVTVDTLNQTTATGEVEGYVADATLTGSKTATPLNEVPQSVSVIGEEEFTDRGATKADEALRYTAGVFTQPFGYDSDTNWIFIRGFQATADGAYLDGLQNYSYAFGGLFVDSFLLERIEVLKGASSVLYGGSNPGGIVNYVSKKPTGERIRYVETGINDAGTGYFGFDIGDSYKDEFDFRVLGRLQGGDGYSDFEDGVRGTISPSLTLHLNDATKLTLLANFTGIDETHNGGAFLPYEGTVVDASFGRIDRDANFTEPGLDYYKRDQASIGYEFEHEFNADWTFRQNARYTHADVSEHSIYGNGYEAGSSTRLSRINFEHDSEVSTFLVDNQIEGKVLTGPIEHRVLGGIDYKYYNLNQVQASALFGTTTSIDVVNPVYGATQTLPVSYTNQDLFQKQLGFYAQDQLRFGDGWIVTLNGRHDSVWTNTQDGPTFYSPTQDNRNESFDSAFSGRAGLAYEFNNGLTPYASIASFFNPQIGTTQFGNMFEPETGTQYEVGIKYQPTFMDALLTVSAFDLTRQNVLTTDPTNAFAQIQTGEIRSRGIEIEAKGKITRNLMATAAFTAYDLEITKDTNAAIVGNTPYIVPEIMGSVWLEYGFDEAIFNGALDGLSVGAGLRYVGESWADQANTLKVPDVTLVDAHVGYGKDNWGVDLNVNNVFDETYVASCQTSTACAYGEGRVIKLKLHATW
ncbi:TonB-dependent siderophore receptor [Roseibium sp.]|uniref:TonB-dependent siderophore receptor n=1 Tax=Roseibium sp. TaxID=1936156 RepID=UPI003A9772D6